MTKDTKDIIFGRQCRYGAFDEFIFNHDDLYKLENIVEQLKTK